MFLFLQLYGQSIDWLCDFMIFSNTINNLFNIYEC